MYVGAWQEYYAHVKRAKEDSHANSSRGGSLSQAGRSIVGLSKTDIKEALMKDSKLEKTAVDEVLKAMGPLLERQVTTQFQSHSGSTTPRTFAPQSSSRQSHNIHHVVDWNAPSSRDRGLRYEMPRARGIDGGGVRNPKILPQFRDERGNMRGLPPLVLDKAQFQQSNYTMSQWYEQSSQGQEGVPLSARSNNTKSSKGSIHSDGYNSIPKRKSIHNHSKISAANIKHSLSARERKRSEELPNLTPMPSGMNTDGGRVSPLLTVVADVDALRRSQASPRSNFISKFYAHPPHNPKDAGQGKQPPYDSAQAVNVLRLARINRGNLRSYWKWSDTSKSKNEHQSTDSKIVRPNPRNEENRVAAVRRMQQTYLEARAAPSLLSGAVDVSLYPQEAAAMVPGNGRNFKPSTMNDSINSFPPTPSTREASRGDLGFASPIMRHRAPATPQIKDIVLSDDDLLLVSKYFDQNKSDTVSQSLDKDNEYEVGTDTSEMNKNIRANAQAGYGGVGTIGTPATPSAHDEAPQGLLEWTSTLDMGTIDNF